MTEARSILAVAMSEEEKREIVKAAREDGRTASGYIRYIVLREIRKGKKDED